MRGGGAERVMLALASTLVARGLEIDLVLAKAEGQYLTHCPSGVRIIDLDASKVSLSLFALTRYLRKTRPTVLLSTMLNANLTAISAITLSGTRTPVVLRVENTMSESAASLADRLLLRLARKMYPKSDALVAVSKGVAKDLVSHFALPNKAITVIYNPIITAELAQFSAQDPGHPWFSAASPPVILGVGRLAPQKNFPLLIQSFSRVAARRDVRLIILGEGPERQSLERLIAELELTDCVSLPGFVSNPFSFMAHAAAFVLSSNFEGLPGTLIEAMACDCPVVSTDCPSGPREITNDGEFGYLVPMDNPEAMAGALDRILSGDCLLPPSPWLEQFHGDYAAERYRQLLAQYARTGLD